jgi:hypothetical protein
MCVYLLKSALDTLLEEERLAALIEPAAPSKFHRRNYKRQRPDYSALWRADKAAIEKADMDQNLGS